MRKIFDDLYHLGDSGCSVFMVNSGSEGGLVLIDCGMNIGLIQKIKNEGFKPRNIKHCFLTHCHIDHIAACNDLLHIAPEVKFYAHELDADPIENTGFNSKTAANWYDINYQPIKLFQRINVEIEDFHIGKYKFKSIHTPGHTPGSISIFVKINDKGALFPGDVHGPFTKGFDSNLKDYQKSMQKLLELNADILCEGHFGIFQPAVKVEEYIKYYMKSNPV
jgi:glyoxylase-like metal-dependent hydrolase (beta-lactamase superfamily II)